MRYSLPNTRVLIHQPSAGFSGQATDIQIHAQEILRVRRRLDEILADHTGKPIEVINHDFERDFFMSAQEAKDYGLIDEIIEGHGRAATNGSASDRPRPGLSTADRRDRPPTAAVPPRATRRYVRR